jgi:hypothetical protein
MLEPPDTPAVAQICRLAAGMPLGIELATAWVPTLPVATIAAELERAFENVRSTWSGRSKRGGGNRSGNPWSLSPWSWKSARINQIWNRV